MERNPTVELKMPVAEIIQNLDLVAVTHTHADHCDEAASKALRKSIELINQPADQEFFQKQGFTNVIAVHMDALDHCRTSRAFLRRRADTQHISPKKLLIPQDGETVAL